MSVTLTVAVPTLGRSSLARTLAPIARAVGPDDAVLVMADGGGDVAAARFIYREVATRNWRFEVLPSSPWGQAHRNWALQQAETTHVWSLNDDDTPTSAAVAAIRAHAHPRRATIFKARFPDGTSFWGQPAEYREPVIWRDPSVRLGNVDAAMIVAPAGCASRWGERYEGDFDFAAALVDEFGAPVWRDETVVLKG